MKVTVKIEGQRGTDRGRGLYVNAIVNDVIYASECLPFDATKHQVDSARKRVTTIAKAQLKKEG